MKVTILQPAYLPWLGFFDRIDASNLCIILDNVQLDTNSRTRFTNRNKIRTKDGWIWLTLPMKTKGLYEKALIKDIEIVNDRWNVKHFKSIEHSYKKTPFYERYIDFLNEIYKRSWVKMQELLDVMLDFFLVELHIKVPIVKASDTPVEARKEKLILELCKYFGATTYYSGIFGREYLDTKKFNEAGIEVFFHEYLHPTYRQNFPGFEPYMCVLDLMFNHGDESLDIIRKGRNFVK